MAIRETGWGQGCLAAAATSQAQVLAAVAVVFLSAASRTSLSHLRHHTSTFSISVSTKLTALAPMSKAASFWLPLLVAIKQQVVMRLVQLLM